MGEVEGDRWEEVEGRSLVCLRRDGGEGEGLDFFVWEISVCAD